MIIGFNANNDWIVNISVNKFKLFPAVSVFGSFLSGLLTLELVLGPTLESYPIDWNLEIMFLSLKNFGWQSDLNSLVILVLVIIWYF